MSIGDRLGIAGVIVALIGIATIYLWPDKKWICWLALVLAACLVLIWVALEIKQTFGAVHISLIAFLAIGALVGICTAAIIWYSSTGKASPSEPAATLPPPQYAATIDSSIVARLWGEITKAPAPGFKANQNFDYQELFYEWRLALAPDVRS
jgi:hypothetical protein